MAANKKQAKSRASSGRTTRSATKSATPSKTTGKTGETMSPSGRMGKSGKTISPVSGRFVSSTTARKSAAGHPVTKKSARKVTTSAAPAVRGDKPTADLLSLEIVAPGIAADMKALVTKLALPKGTLDKLVEKGQLLQVFTGTGKSETFRVGDDMAAYLKALRAQLDEVVLPSVLARLVKGAAPIAPEDLAQRMLAVAPAPVPANRMAQQVGPEYYDTNGVKTVLAAPGAEPVSKQAVEHRRNRHTILALQTTDRRWIYPTWQFRDHDVLPGLADVLATFYPPQPSGRDQTAASAGRESGSPGAMGMARSATQDEPYSRWSVATWVTTPLRDLDGLSVAEWLLEDHDRDRVVQLARRTAAAWAA